MAEFIQFRFVPTMRCNLRCSYCFLGHSRGTEPTMFDSIPPATWVAAMAQFAGYEVEFYCWGGEPFCIEGTYHMVKGFCEYDFVKWARIDTNLTFADNIVALCPSSKVKLLCSWHTESMSYAKLKESVLLLAQHDMVGMVNFVASDVNVNFLQKNRLDLDEIVREFHSLGIFVNVAPDFNKGNDPRHRDFIIKYTMPKDWEHIHGLRPSRGAPCDAGETFFSVHQDGRLETCARPRKNAGDFLTGKVKRKARRCPQERCRCIISYCHRLDQVFSPRRHLEDYIKRNSIHRVQTGLLH